MLSPRDNFLETIKLDGKPDRLVNQYEPVAMILPDPILLYERGGVARGKTFVDPWGVTFIWPENQPAAAPFHSEENRVIKDILNWREELRIPDSAEASTGWEEAAERAAQIDRSRYLATVLMSTGIFERLHFLMGFEDALTDMLLEPEAYADLCDAILESRMNNAKALIDHLKPDAVLSHDDWGMKTSLFMSPDAWRTFFKPRYKKLYDCIHSRGVLVIHHADSFLEPIVADMAEIGIDVWQGALPQNDIVRLQKEIGGRMTLMGGLDSANLDRPNSTEEEIRKETRRACETYGPGGHFIPCSTYGVPGDTIHPHIDAIVSDEIERYNDKLYRR
ncbi:MAG: uroporphyrinogen decarboxylase (URO-D) [Clostridiales Family XIII bacterium]|jgi:uroporphyrinogen-III decarboxylase|nr:uroporphyrinogen decarboxylase (URO-D) [Clostridiales Family XIII bacterium]